ERGVANERLTDSEKARRAAERAAYGHAIGHAQAEWNDNNLNRVERILGDCPEGLRGWEWHYLRRLCHADLLAIPGPHGMVVLAASPDGRLLASARGDPVVRVHDTATGELVRELSGHTLQVTCVAWSPDGRLLASGTGGRRLAYGGVRGSG